ncbi:MAG: GTP pyrophosphokinase [Lachnospiraceae bacterium]|nr:GTP pyrophosphokinase [Lachnospiraceae bacterium]
MNEDLKKSVNEIEFYMQSLGVIEACENIFKWLVPEIEKIDAELSKKAGRPVVEYTRCRIKSAESIVNKLQRKGREITYNCAIATLHDLAGIRVICSFQDDVYHMTRKIRKIKGLKIRKVKDYIAHPKSSGYRSIHMMIDIPFGEQTIGLEIQVRSAAMNYWATLEHQMSYKNKKESGKETDKIRKELKDCAIDIAEIDKRFLKLRKRIEKL